MLSPGKLHELVPRDLESNLKYRLWVYREAHTVPGLVPAIISECKSDLIFFLDTFAWSYDPRKPAARRVAPFVTWDYQREALLKPRGILWSIERGRDHVIEKSRDMGATVVCLFVQSWLALFHDYTQILDISRNEKAVDDPSPDSLFWKLKWAIDHMPRWLTGRVDKNKLTFAFERTRSTIAGEATTTKAGVGGRASLIFLDEFPEIAHGQTVREKTANTADARIFNGTHKGVGTAFHKMTTTPEIDRTVMHWSAHPRKKPGLYRRDPQRPTQVEVIDKTYEFPADYEFVLDGTPTGGPYPGLRSPWYDAMVKKMGDSRAVAQDLDIDPSGASSQVFEPLVIYSLRQTIARPPTWVGDVAAAEVGDGGVLVARPNGPLRLWVPVVHGRPHVGRAAEFGAGTDISWGRGVTNSCVSIFSVAGGEKVAEYAAPDVKPEELARMSYLLLGLFGDVLIAWETPGPGEVYGDEMIRLGWPTYYRKVDEHDPVKKYKLATRPGWNNNPKGIASLLSKYNTALEKRVCVNWSDIALAECLEYRFNSAGYPEHGGSTADMVDPSGAKVGHGDRVIADALAWFMCEKRGSREQAGQEPGEERPEPGPPLVGSYEWRREQYTRMQREKDRWTV